MLSVQIKHLHNRKSITKLLLIKKRFYIFKSIMFITVQIKIFYVFNFCNKGKINLCVNTIFRVFFLMFISNWINWFIS